LSRPTLEYTAIFPHNTPSWRNFAKATSESFLGCYTSWLGQPLDRKPANIRWLIGWRNGDAAA
jgi:hypothetical protein